MPEASADAVAIEPATPADAADAANLIVTTDLPLFRYLGGGDVDFTRGLLETLWRERDGIFSHALALVAWRGPGSRAGVAGVMVGMTAKVRAAQLDASNRAAAALVPPARAGAIFDAWSAVDWLSPEIPDNAYYVQNLAVAAAERRRRLGGLLLEHAVTIARAADASAVHLDVAADNPALAFYERNGFVRTARTHVPALDAQGIAPHWRMVRDLATAPPSAGAP
jgi:ribosomal protein S18 acetylase RimI-like enzyme